MIPLQIDINPNQDVSTTMIKDQIECLFLQNDSELDLHIYNHWDHYGHLISSSTSTSLILSELSVNPERSNNLVELEGEFDIISKFKYKNSKKIRVKLNRVEFKQRIIID